MSQAFGYNTFFGWKKETTYGTAATPANKWAEVESVNVSDDRKLIHKPLLGSVSRRRVVRGKHSPGLSVKFPLMWNGLEQLLEAALGSVATTGPSGALYTHAFTPSAALPTGLTCEVDIDEAAISGDHTQQLIGAQIDKLTITQEVDQTLDCEIELVGREWADIARTSPTLPTYDAIDYSQMTVAAINPGTANIDLVARKFKLEINNNLFKEKYRLTGAGKRAGFGRASQRHISMEVEVEYESDSILTYFKNATITDLQFKWARTNGAGISSLTIAPAAGYFQGSRPSSSDSGPVYMTMNYEAVMLSADNDECPITLINTTSSV